MSWLRSRLAAPSPSMVVALVALVLAAGGVTYAAIPDSGTNVYHACMLKNVGTIRIIDPSLPSSNPRSHCSSLETAVTWNQQGPKGEPGSQGLKGEQGVQGLKGDTGANGANGHDGQPGTNGKDGAPGQDGKSFSWRGDWSALAAYLPQDVVSYFGSSYIALSPNAGEPPESSIHSPWDLLARKGDPGANGDKGDKGDKGDAGVPGTAKAYATVHVLGSPSLDPTRSKNVISVARLSAGTFCVELAPGIDRQTSPVTSVDASTFSSTPTVPTISFDGNCGVNGIRFFTERASVSGGSLSSSAVDNVSFEVIVP